MADCSNLDLLAALQLWAGGAKLDGYCLYGISTVWIGRLAKITAFVAAIPILIDIIGETRIRALSDNLRQFSRIFRRRVERNVRRVWTADDGPNYPASQLEEFLQVADTVMTLIASFVLWRMTPGFNIWMKLLAAPFVLFILFVMIGIAMFLLTFALPRILAGALTPVENVFGHPRLTWGIRVGSALLLLIAFLLDLLTS